MTHNRNKSTTYWTLAITSLALFMVSLDNLVVTTALPVIRRDLHATISQLEWTVNAYTLTFAVLLLTGAALGDRFGRRRLFVLGLLLFTGASAAAALSTTANALDIARARAREHGAARHRVGPRARKRPRLDECRNRRPARCRCAPRCRLRRLGAARLRADAPDALLPRPHVRAHERGVPLHVLRDVRVD